MSDISFWIIDISTVLISVIFITLSLIMLSLANFDFKIINQYSKIWDEGLIEDIILSNNTNNECPENYDFFLDLKFPGNIAGCDCFKSDVLGLKGILFKEQCSYFQFEKKCENIINREDFKIHKWQNSLLCVKRNKNNYFDLIRKGKIKQKCNENNNEKKCGIVDTEGNFLCLSKNETCPINKLEIIPNNNNTTKTENNTNTNNNTKISNKIQLKSHNKTLIFSNNFNNDLLNSHVTASNYGACINSLEGRIGENDYILNENKGSSLCLESSNIIKTKNSSNEVYDYRFKYLDQEPMKDFYTENGINIYLDYLPFYPKSYEISKAILQKISYFGIKENCLNNENFNKKSILNFKMKIENLNDDFFVISIIFIIHFVLIIIWIVFFKVWYLNFKTSLLIFIIFDIINCGLILLCIVLLFNSLSKLRILLSPFHNLFESNVCFDKITTMVFQKAFSGIDKIYGFLYSTITFAFIFISIIIIHYIIFIVIIKRKKVKNIYLK